MIPANMSTGSNDHTEIFELCATSLGITTKNPEPRDRY